ncbi:PREDICTED: transcription factor FAMA [Tarenaya hassleriana]|uniref:transcription factor FAMA n=1 Tax=Tarenaya hassleriana TaxID=28532 RepID=UPI00053C32EC|nr:PREDICTED: transcription factor FAMA [Tarenaya hassleriana]
MLSYLKPDFFQALNHLGESSDGGHDDDNVGMIDYMLSNSLQQQPEHEMSPGFDEASPSFDKLSFPDAVMQFSDFGPKPTLNHTKIRDQDQETGIDPVYFLKFPVLNDNIQDHHQIQPPMVFREGKEGQEARVLDRNNNSENKNMSENEAKGKRKRRRTIKTSEEVESQRMTHIAVERNRRKQMNEHLRVLRSLMPGSYVQRGDQASIIGGAIEFVRELEQLLQCLESQKRRRLSETASSSSPSPSPLNFPANESEEETAEKKSCFADVEVKILGFDAMIKILSRSRPGQLVKTISALEDLRLCVLHANITTIEQTVLYSFSVKMTSEKRFTAEDIANSIQQIFSFIHANTAM